MQDLTLMVIGEGQQYGTDREIATISLLKQQPLILWTGDAQQTPGGILERPPTPRGHANSYWPRNMGFGATEPTTYRPTWRKRWSGCSMTRLMKACTCWTKRYETANSRVWTEQLSSADEEALRAVHKVLPGLDSHFRTALPSEQAQLPTKVDAMLLEGSAINFLRSLIRLAWMLQHAETLLPMAGEIQAELNSHTAGVRDIHAWGLMLPSSSPLSCCG